MVVEPVTMSSLTQGADETFLTDAESTVGDYYQFAASFAQERLWFLQQLEPQSTAYNSTSVVRLRGALKIDALRQGLQMLVARHESLRTTLRAEEGQVMQLVATVGAVHLQVVDCHTVAPAQEEAHVLALIQAARQEPFDLARGPLWRVLLYQLTADWFVLAVIKHHIITDAWSTSIFWRELALFYTCAEMNQPSPLPELPIHYADFALWQRERLQGDVVATQLAYWKAQLAGSTPILLPTDQPRLISQRQQGADEHFALSPALYAALKTVSQTAGVTLFTTLLAAFQVLLLRYSGATDIAVGSPVANRHRPELEGVIGLLLNTLVLRTDLTGNPTFRQLLERVQRVVIDAQQHQEIPFEKLVQELQPDRTLNRTPLLQVLFALRNAPQALMLPGVQGEYLRLQSENTKADLTLVLTEGTDGIQGSLTYRTDLYHATTIRRLITHFVTLVQGIVANPDCPIAQLPLLTPAERHQLVVEWNQTATDYPHDKCIHQLVEEQVERTPDAVALMFGKEQVRYRELNALANQLAHHLVSVGVKPGVNVGIAVERSVAMVVGLVAILKAGGVYVPLDITYPAERLALMLEDTAAPVLLTQAHLTHLFTNSSVAVVVLDKDGDEIACHPRTNLPNRLVSAAPAYILYTSGSTGRPKGVMIPHRAISRLLINTNYIAILATDRIAQAANIAFDAATFEIWGALLHGATLVGIPRTVTLAPHALAAYLREQAITVLFLTTALFNQSAHSVPDAFATLRVLLFGGERVDPAPVRLVLQHGAPTQLLHVYGPTESTTFSTWRLIQTVAADAHTIPIGTPLANTQLYLLDSQLQPVPIGVTGELYIGGDGLALGYHNRPALTAESWLANPFGAGRLYKTGDLARYLPDGNIEFLRRIDNQVKLRGFRIELGEIEALLRHQPGVQEVAVVVRADAVSGEYRLIAYLVAQAPLEPAMLRTYLAAKLPDYMVPSAFVNVAALPLTPNGKVDQQALPAPGAEHRSRKAYVAPRTPIEHQVTELWSAHLGVAQVGMYDNFFELGGHSLLAVRVTAAMHKTFGVDVPLAVLMAEPTIAGVAGYLWQQREGAAPPIAPVTKAESLVPIRPTGMRPPFFLVPGGSGGETEFLVYAPLLYQLGDDQPVYGLQARGLDGVTPPHRDVESMAAAYVEAIRTVQPQGPYFLGGECIGGKVAFAMACHLQAQGEKVALLVLLDTVLEVTPPQPYYSYRLRWLRRRFAYHWQQVRQLPLRAQVRYLQKEVGVIGRLLTPQSQASAQVRHRRQVQQNYQYLANTYRPTHLFVGNLSLIYSQKILAGPSAAAWQRVTTGRVEVHAIPGVHQTYLAQHLNDTAACLRTCLWRAQAGQQPPTTRETRRASLINNRFE